MHALGYFFVGLALPAIHFAGTWTQYRGSNQDATAGQPIRTNWNETPPAVLWKKPLPFGLSSFSVGDDGRIYTMGRRVVNQVDSEFCIALDAATGTEIWAAPIGLADYPNAGVGSDDGPRSTPTIDGDRVLVFGSYMALVCLNASTGAEIWRRELTTDFGARVIPWQNAASPTVVGDLVFVNTNGRDNEHLAALRKSDGVDAWKRGSFGMTHATPLRATIGGVEQVIFLAQRALVSVEPATGNVLWQFALRYNGTSVAASPVIAGETVYISRAYPGSLSAPQAGALVLNITNVGGTFSASRKWEKVNELMNHWATPVYHGGHYYGVFGQSILTLRCVDASNGDTKWQTSGVGYGSVSLAGDKLIVLEDDGNLALVETDPTEYREIHRFRPLNGKCWNNPAIASGRIYIRSTTEALALDVSTGNSQPDSPLKLAVSSFAAGRLTLEVATEDGTAIDAGRAAAISVWSTADSLSGGAWTRVTNSTVLTNGKLTLEATAAEPQRFFRTEEPQ